MYNELSVGGGGLISTTTIHNVIKAKVKKKKIYFCRREQFGIERKKETHVGKQAESGSSPIPILLLRKKSEIIINKTQSSRSLNQNFSTPFLYFFSFCSTQLYFLIN